MNKKILYRFIKLLFSEFNQTYSVHDFYTNIMVYEEVFNFIQNDLGISDDEKVDFIYASFYETLKNLNGNLSSFSENDVIIPIKNRYQGKKSYYATVYFEELYTYDTYLPIILENMVHEFQIDEDDVKTDIHDTWDIEVDIKKLK
jgi:hypothetical protein